MNIWIDLANSPQVLFFRPLIKELQRQGHELTITSRDFAQTLKLADHYGLTHTPVGGHGGKKLARIGMSLMQRAMKLYLFAGGKKFDLAVSHNSYSQAVAAFCRGIPLVTLMDFEHQPANHLCFRLASKVMVPEFFPDWALRKYGAGPRKTVRYPGLKEQIYLADFSPQRDFLEKTGIPPERIIVVMRPPGEWGLYHNFANPLFGRVVQYLASHPEIFIVFLPRISAQGEALRKAGYSNAWVPPEPLDGPNLLYHADLVVSGGGTMNREAAVLGTPAYSVFKGRMPAVDRHLIDSKRLRFIGAEAQISDIHIGKKPQRDFLGAVPLINYVTQALINN